MKYYKVRNNINTVDEFIGHVGYSNKRDNDFIYLVIPYFNNNEKYEFFSDRLREISKEEYIRELFKMKDK